MTKRILSNKDNWLAAEYALGVLDQDAMAEAQSKYDNEIAFRHTVDDWHSQFEPFLDDIDEVMPNKAVWKQINENITAANPSEVSSPVGIWKLITALCATAAVASLSFLMYVTEGDFTGQRIKGLEQELASAETTIETANQQVTSIESELAQVNNKLASTQSELSQKDNQLTAATEELSQTKTELTSVTKNANKALDQLASANDELTSTRNQLVSAQSEISEIKRAIDESTPLVASLSQSGDAPAFVAQYDPLKGSLLIRTAIEDTTEKVPEIWLIPSGGPREGDVLSLGVMNEDAPEEVKLSKEFLPLVTEGGTLAITMEPPGGAPNGVATGPIIALGKLQAFK